MASESLKVAVIGGGPAGLTLTRLLVRASIPVICFEREASPDARSQGGTLDLHAESGQRALKDAGLWDEFLKHARYDGDVMVIVDKHGKKHMVMGGDDDAGAGEDEEADSRPEIDRVKLRQILIESIPGHAIRWNSNLVGVDADCTLHFQHGDEEGFDIVVGADGAWSKVRPLLTDVQPLYSGVGGIDFRLEDIDTRLPQLGALVGKGSYFAFGDGKTLMAQRQGDGSVTVAAWALRAATWQDEPPYAGVDLRGDPKAAKDIFLQHAYFDWAPEVQDLIRLGDDAPVNIRNLYMLPVGHRWPARPGFTLIGDAAHLMTPFAGEGVNTAMRDALELARAVITASNEARSPEVLARVTASYEEEMFLRAAMVTKKSKMFMDVQLADDAPEGFLRVFAAMMEQMQAARGGKTR
ncbi:MAG: hypothetical protein M1832_005099 [Thelocarpon impressellum]|nr:MAG: hypothetical protein M1832_005099 [Thelocarpon impressellum]